VLLAAEKPTANRDTLTDADIGARGWDGRNAASEMPRSWGKAGYLLRVLGFCVCAIRLTAPRDRGKQNYFYLNTL